MNRADNAMTTVLKYFIGTYAIVSHGAFTLNRYRDRKQILQTI